MSSTLAALRTAVLNRVGLPSTDGMAQPTTLDSLLNEAARDLATDKEWPWLEAEGTFTLTAGTTSYTPAAGVTRTQFLAIESDDLELRQRRDLTRLAGQTGRPLVYAESGERLLFAPTPDQDYTITHGYVSEETTVVGDSDVFLCPVRYEALIVLGASVKLAVRLKDRELVAELRKERAEMLARTVDNARRSAALPKVRIRGDV